MLKKCSKHYSILYYHFLIDVNSIWRKSDGELFLYYVSLYLLDKQWIKYELITQPYNTLQLKVRVLKTDIYFLTFK